MKDRLKRLWPWLLLLGAGLFLADDAWARMGGGQGFGGGGGSGSGGSGGSGSGGELALLRLLLWLCLEYPIVGIPLTIAVCIAWIWVKRRGGRQTYRTHEYDDAPTRPVPSRPDFNALKIKDPNFSELLFQDLVQLIFIRSHEARRSGDFGGVQPFLAPKAMEMLRRRCPVELEDVILGSSRIKTLTIQGREAQIGVDFEANVTEAGAHTYLRQVWVFRRQAKVLSPGPDKMQALRCVNCGSGIETDVEGRCRHCETPISDGRLQWQCQHIVEVERRPVRAPELSLGGGEEPGVRRATRMQRDLVPALRALQTRQPEFQPAQFRQWVSQVFIKLQDAWATQRWEQARPYLTDPLFQSLRYQIEQHKRARLTNHCEQVTVTKVEMCRVALDAYYQSVTVRLFAKMIDYTADQGGKVVGGHAKKARIFSEYWTFVRAVGHKAEVKSAEVCPNCGAPLDRVDLGGICGYCDTRITGGEHSWVLSTITQDEVYAG